MKKILIFTMLAASIGFSVVGVEARPERSPAGASALNANGPQIINQILRRQRHRGRNRNNGNVRYEKRIVHKGRKVYEDTYRITFKNGREHVKRISRVRIR